jgi:hypothetical protein
VKRIGSVETSAGTRTTYVRVTSVPAGTSASAVVTPPSFASVVITVALPASTLSMATFDTSGSNDSWIAIRSSDSGTSTVILTVMLFPGATSVAFVDRVPTGFALVVPAATTAGWRATSPTIPSTSSTVDTSRIDGRLEGNNTGSGRRGMKINPLSRLSWREARQTVVRRFSSPVIHDYGGSESHRPAWFYAQDIPTATVPTATVYK